MQIKTVLLALFGAAIATERSPEDGTFFKPKKCDGDLLKDLFAGGAVTD